MPILHCPHLPLYLPPRLPPLISLPPLPTNFKETTFLIEGWSRASGCWIFCDRIIASLKNAVYCYCHEAYSSAAHAQHTCITYRNKQSTQTPQLHAKHTEGLFSRICPLKPALIVSYTYRGWKLACSLSICVDVNASGRQDGVAISTRS